MYRDIPSIGSAWFYGVFAAAIFVMLFVDILVLNKKGTHRVSTKEACIWSLVWVLVSTLFASWLYLSLSNNPLFGTALAKSKSLEFFTGYLIEKALAVDNIFVFVMIFSYFKIPIDYQRRVLLYGVFGAIVLRTLMVFVGAAIVAKFAWVLYLFGAFLIFTGVKMLACNEEIDLSKNKILRFVKRFLRVSSKLDGERFFIVRGGFYFATPMFLVLLMIELSDVIFALDSIPAIFAVTTDPFIVLTSNIFAVLGLRAMYFLLVNIANRLHFLKYGLSIILIFVGLKMLIVDFFHIPVGVSLGIVFLILAVSIFASLLVRHKKHTNTSS